MPTFLRITFLFLFIACAHNKTSQETVVDQSTSTEQKEIYSLITQHDNEHLKTAGHMPVCDGCIIGSSAPTPESENSDNKKYFLYGAEHLGLKNMYFDIPVVYNDSVKMWINYFTGRGRELYQRYSERAGIYAPVLSKILGEQGLPRDLIYLSMAESGFHTKAKSWAKAVGAWQFMPYTGKKFGLKIDFYVDERRDPIKATKAASRYLKTLYNMFGNWELAMASYNAGEGKMKRAIKRYKTNNFWQIRRGRYLRAETKNYVPKIMALAIIGKNLESFGFDNIEYDDHLNFEEVKVYGNQDLYQISEALGVDFEEIHFLNSELRRWQTPPVDSYMLRIPAGMGKKWVDCCSLKDYTSQDFQRYVIKKGGNLKLIARIYKVPVDVLSDINGGMNPNKKLHRGQTVLLPFREGQSRKHNMYADLYDKPRRSVVRRRKYRRRLQMALKRGAVIENPKVYYTVKKGDSLWSISRKFDVSLDTLIRTNYRLVKKGMVMPGEKLAIR